MSENLNLQTVETVDTQPFRRLIMTIGELPTSFIESMTYYELLAWFTNYLETVIIPTVNNNGECVEELQQKYIELKHNTEAEIARFEDDTDAEIERFENATDAEIERFETDLTEAFNTLKNFVDNYFENLDVQEEIDNKLDEMANNGSLYRLINDEIFGDINSQILHQAQEINDLNNAQLQNVKKNESNSITMDMLSQGVREALTGGSTPVVGDDAVGTENIKDKAVTILKLETNLQNNFDLNITKCVLSNEQLGYYSVVGDTVGGNVTHTLPASDNMFKCYTYNLTKGKTYRYTGFNYYGSHGLIVGTAVGSASILLSPSNGTLSESTFGGIDVLIYGTDIVFTVTEDNLVAFVTTFTDEAFAIAQKPSLLKDYAGLYEVTDITPYDRTVTRDNWTAITPTYTYDHTYMQQTVSEGATNNRNPYRLQSINLNGYEVRFYKLYKNHKYRATGTQKYDNAGFTLYDNYCKVTYISQQYSSSTASSFDYEFTATNDGFAIVQDVGPQTAQFYEATESSLTNTRISGTKIAYNGDSITESRTDEESVSYNGGAYPKIISDLTDSSYDNFSVGGGTLAYKSGGGHRICRDITNMTGDYDAIIFSGGINDYWQDIPLGTFTENDYTSNVDDTTVCGALESIFRQAINKWCGKPIMFVITHKIYGTAYTQNNAGYTFNDLHDKIVAICHKYSIPYYDCYEDGGLNSYISVMNTTYMTAGASGNPDYTHPNKAAYERYYVPQVISMIEENLKY